MRCCLPTLSGCCLDSKLGDFVHTVLGPLKSIMQQSIKLLQDSLEMCLSGCCCCYCLSIWLAVVGEAGSLVSEAAALLRKLLS